MENFYNFTSIIRIILKWKKHLTIIVLISILLSFFFTLPFIIKPKFKSFAIVYPANIAPYSEESNTEQLLQIFDSEDIKDSIIKRFGLAKHYKIDTTSESYYTTLMNTFEDHLSIKKTDYESVNIEFIDTDKKLAYNVVKSYIDLTNNKIRTLQREKLQEVYNIIKREHDKKKREMDSLRVVVVDLRNKYGFIDLATQAVEATKGLLGTVEGSSARINYSEVTKTSQNILLKGNEFDMAAGLYGKAKDQYLDFKNQIENAEKELRKEFTYTSIVTHPRIPDKKCAPIRWLIVLTTALCTLFISIIAIIAIENKNFFKTLINNSKE